MSLAPTLAEQLLRTRLGDPINPVPSGAREGKDNEKVLGFATRNGRVLALNREMRSDTRIWFQPPAPSGLAGVRVRATSSINANLSGQLSVLNERRGLQVEIDSETSLERFLDWYAGTIAAAAVTPSLRPRNFAAEFARFQRLIVANDHGHPFTNFGEGIAAAWEDYKPRLRDHALKLLAADAWSETSIGAGSILQHVIDAIEIQDSRINLTNNLVFWQNRFGHANRDHRVLLEAQTNQRLRRELEGLFFRLYCGGEDEGLIFDPLSRLVAAKYPLLAYLFFLKDMDRFMPVQPTTFDRAFRHLGIDLVTLSHCSWDNYRRFNGALGEVQKALAGVSGLSRVRLIDAHSFCFMLEKLPEPGEEGAKHGRMDAGRIVGGRERAIIDMRTSIENTVRNSNGQSVQRTLKNKETDLSSAELDKLLTELLDLQDNRCALTGIELDFAKDGDRNLYPSPDRIDSGSHYVRGNIQVVCRFINGWKGATDNDEFLRLLTIVRSGHGPV